MIDIFTMILTRKSQILGVIYDIKCQYSDQNIVFSRIYPGLEIFFVNPRFLTIDVMSNLGLTWDYPGQAVTCSSMTRGPSEAFTPVGIITSNNASSPVYPGWEFSVLIPYSSLVL